MLWRLQETIGVQVPVRVLFDTADLSEFAAAVDDARGGSGGFSVPARVSEPVLSHAQLRLWFLDQLAPGESTFNLPIAVRLAGHLDVSALERAIACVVARHEVLRTTFGTTGGRPWQRIAAPAPVTVAITDLRGLPLAEREAQARRVMAEETGRPFDLAEGPVFRIRLIRLADEEHSLIWTVHHIAGDGWSLGLITRELTAAYRAEVTGEPANLPVLALQYADFAAAQREWLDGPGRGVMLDYWRGQLEGAGQLDLPTDHPRAGLRNDGAAHTFELDADLAARLRDFCAARGITLFTALLAAFEVLLHRYSGQDGFTVGCPVTDRPRVEMANLIGLFLNAVVMRADCSGDPTFADLLDRVRDTAVAAFAHQELPFEMLVDELRPDRDLARNPLFQVDFQLHPRFTSADEFDLPGLTARDESQPPTTTAVLDLSLYMSEWQGRLRGVLRYKTGLFEPETIRRMAEQFTVLLTAAVTDAGRPISTLPLITGPDRDQLVHGWNATAVDHVPACVHTLFEQQAERTPDAVAVEFEGETLSYRELDRQANRLAVHLRQLGAGVEDCVGLCLDRGVGLIVAVLGILKAGSAYLPLEPTHPTERIAGLVADTGARIVVTQTSLRDRTAATGAHQLCLDTLPDLNGAADRRPIVEVAPHNLAYVMYTSGSTGQPKGVPVEHRGVANFARELPWTPAGTTGRVALNASIAFDQSLDTLLALAHGWQVVLVPAEVRLNPDLMLTWLGQADIDVLECTPTQVDLLLRAGLGDCPHRPGVMLVSGEEIDARLWARLRALTGTTVWNAYGPTECTIDTTVARVGDFERPTVGRPIGNAQVYILDDQWNPVPVGVAGEVYIGGVGLARAYLNRPAATARQFVPDPFGGAPGGRLYRTGDRGRFRPDGTIEFLGRADNQVKIRGYRIEPAEVEAVLRTHPDLTAATVAVHDDGRPGGRRLVAYVVSEPAAAAPTSSALRAHLRRTLPEHMVPSAFVRLGALPLTPNGKLDRQVLPAPDERPDLDSRFEPPRTPTELALAEIWAEGLGLSNIGVHDNFFELGGHSLLAFQVRWEARQRLGVELPLDVFFEALTVAQLADAVDALTETVAV